MCPREEAIREVRRAARALSGACLARLVKPGDSGGRGDGRLPDAFLHWLAGERP